MIDHPPGHGRAQGRAHPSTDPMSAKRTPQLSARGASVAGRRVLAAVRTHSCRLGALARSLQGLLPPGPAAIRGDRHVRTGKDELFDPHERHEDLHGAERRFGSARGQPAGTIHPQGVIQSP